MSFSLQDFNFYFGLGWEHIISADALDHQIFILALAAVYSFRELKQVLIFVTAFTIGHSATLVLSVLDIVRFPSNIVEFLIPCTIVVTALNNLYRINAVGANAKWNYYLAVGFGLVHGMGFANAIRMMLAKDQNIGWGLFSFNLGVEIGQLVLVVIVLLAAMGLVDFLNVKRRDWVLFISSGVFALSMQMVIERWPY